MNVLLVYPASPPSQWPRGAFRSRWVPTGLACMATVLRRGGHGVKIHLSEQILESNGYDRVAADNTLRELLLEFRPGIVGISLVSSALAEGLRIARQAKELLGEDVMVVVGGAHPTALPEQTLDGCTDIDAAVIGEGEHTLLELADGGLSPSVAGLVMRRDGELVHTPPRPPVTDLDSLGPPAYDLFDMKHFTAPSRWLIRFLKLSATNLRTSRGCTNACSFCAGYLVGGVGVRNHSVEYVIDQMKHAAGVLGVEAVRFEDDTVGADPRRLRELCGAIRHAGLHQRLKWEACLRVDQADADLLAEMKGSGCIQVEYGFESGSSEVLRRLGKQADLELNRRAVELTRRAGLRIFADIMVCLPGETMNDLHATMRFLRWARPEVISMARLCPLPGTALFKGLDPAVRDGIDWGGWTYPDAPAAGINFSAVDDHRFEEFYRRLRKYFLGPQMTRALLRDTPRADRAQRRDLRKRLRRFVLRHPLRALRVPW